MGPGLVAEQPTVPTAGESINCAARSKYDCRAALRLAVSLGVTASRLLLCFTACERPLGWEIMIIINKEDFYSAHLPHKVAAQGALQ